MSKIIKNNISYAGVEDSKVKQNETSTDAEYEVLLSGTADNTTRTEEVRKSEGLTYNPDSETLSVNHESSGTVSPTISLDGSTGDITATSLNGSVVGTSPVFTDSNVTQNEADTSINIPYPVLFSGADATTYTSYTGEVNKIEHITYNPNQHKLKIMDDDLNSSYISSTKIYTYGDLEVADGITATSLNGVTIGSSPKFTDTTYTSKAAASGGTDVSLCTTGEKYNWNRTNNVLPGYKVRIVSFTLGSVDIKTAFGSLYRSANLTRDITSASIGNMTTITALFPSCYRSDGTVSTQINLQAIIKSGTTFTVNYVLIRPTSGSVTSLHIHFLVIGT